MGFRLFFLVLLVFCSASIGFSQKVFKNLDSTPKEWHKLSLDYLEAVIYNFKNKKDKNKKDSIHYYRATAAMYANLGESADTVFKYIDKFLALDKSVGCLFMVAHESTMKDSKSGMYWGKLDKNKYLSRLIPCQNYIEGFNSDYEDKIKSDSTLDQNMILLIEKMEEDDQRYRNPEFDYEKQKPLDAKNQVLLDSIFTNYGFPGKSKVGIFHASVVATVFLHMDIDFQEKWQPLLVKNFKNKELDNGSIIFALDRYHVMKYKKQLFGTQQLYDSKTDRYEQAEKYSDQEREEILRSLGVYKELR